MTIAKLAMKEDDLSTNASGESGDELCPSSSHSGSEEETVPATSRSHASRGGNRGLSSFDQIQIHSAAPWLFALAAGLLLALEWLMPAAAVLTLAFLTRPTKTQKPPRTTNVEVPHRLEQSTKTPSQAPKTTATTWRSTRVVATSKREPQLTNRHLPTRMNTPAALSPEVASTMLKEVSAIMKVQDAAKPATAAPKPAAAAPWRSSRVDATKAAPGAPKTATVAPWRSARVSAGVATEKQTQQLGSIPKVSGPSEASLAALMAALAAAETAKSMDESESAVSDASVLAPAASASVPAYTPAGFRKQIVSMMKELAQHRNTAVAVGNIRELCIPQELQAAEFADVLTRTMEERNGPLRRTYVAFVAGLVAGSPKSAFCKKQCLSGLTDFFTEAYEELAAEVPRLDKLAQCELVPTLRGVFSNAELKTILPLNLQTSA